MASSRILLTALVSFVHLFHSASGAFCAQDPIVDFPTITPETDTIICYVSVTSLAEEPFLGVDLLAVLAPVNASVTQVMKLADTYSGGDFWFESDYHEMYGTYVHTINGLSNNDPYYWFLYDELEYGQANCGTDYIRARDNDHFHWLYEEYIYEY